MIELHNVLFAPDIANTLYSIIEHSRQPDYLLVIKNGATTVGFPTFTLLANNNKEMTLYDDLPFKDQHSPSMTVNLTVRVNPTKQESKRAKLER